MGADRRVRKAFEAARKRYAKEFSRALAKAEPITPENVLALENDLAAIELALGRQALQDAGAPKLAPHSPSFARQHGTTCMSTSLGNALVSLGEPAFQRETDARVAQLAEDVVANTSAMGKPGEYRSVDDLFKYLESGRLKGIDLGGAACTHDYRARLTGSLLWVLETLWRGTARLVVQRRAHARLVFSLDEGEGLVRSRDPMASPGEGFERMTLETLRGEFLWGPLKKIPRILGPGALPSLTAEECLGHLERYEDMDNLGLDCPSALVFRAEDAPARRTPPPEA